MELSPRNLAALRSLGVVTLYLFGSRAQGIARVDSDYDFGVLLKDTSMLANGSQELYQKIYEILQDAVAQRVNLDIVFLDRANVQLRFHVVCYGTVLLDDEPLARGRFIQRTLEENADFEPHRKLFDKTTLERIA